MPAEQRATNAAAADAAADDDDDWVRITSMNGFSFIVRRGVANVSGTLRNMLDANSNFLEASSKTCAIHDSADLVEKAIEYMAFRRAYDAVPPRDDVPVSEFLERLSPECALGLLLLADYLDL